MLSRQGKWIIIITGMLAILFVSSQVLQSYSAAIVSHHYQSQKTKAEKASKSKTDDSRSDATYVVAASEAVIPIVKLQINTLFYLVKELILLCEIETEVGFSPPTYTNTFFVTLFQNIICPNAP